MEDRLLLIVTVGVVGLAGPGLLSLDVNYGFVLPLPDSFWVGSTWWLRRRDGRGRQLSAAGADPRADGLRIVPRSYRTGPGRARSGLSG
jgi:hypothetical protein